LSWRKGSARAARSASGVPLAVEGMTWKVWRSPIHGLGSWLSPKACSVGRLSALFACWYS
jgi:hypothetical protein